MNKNNIYENQIEKQNQDLLTLVKVQFFLFMSTDLKIKHLAKTALKHLFRYLHRMKLPGLKQPPPHPRF